MIIAVSAIFLSIIFPIFINAFVLYDNNEKKLYFNLCVFSISIISGYVERTGIALQIRLKRKTIKVPLKKLLSIRGSFKPLKDYHVFNVKSFVNVGAKSNGAVLLVLGAFSNTFINAFNQYHYNRRKRNLILNSTNYILDEGDFSVSLKSLFVINILMILISLTKMILEKIKNGK